MNYQISSLQESAKFDIVHIITNVVKHVGQDGLGCRGL